MTPEEFRHPTIEQLSGINLFYEEGRSGPMIIGPGQPLTPQVASSDSFNHEIDDADPEAGDSNSTSE